MKDDKCTTPLELSREELIELIRENMKKDLETIDKQAIVSSIESCMLEGFLPTKESIRDIIDLVHGTSTIEEVACKHRNRSMEDKQ